MMKKHRLKNYLKLGVLLFGIPLILFTCQTDNIVQEEIVNNSKSLPELTSKIWNGNEIISSNSFLTKRLEPFLETDNSLSKSSESNTYEFSIDTTNIQTIETNSYISYTSNKWIT